MSGELDDQTLIQSAQHGDLEAFNVLIDRYQSLAFRIALRILGDEDHASDATQMAWISAFRSIGGLRGGHLRTWLARVVVNACYDDIRHERRRRELPLLGVDIEGQDIDADAWLADPAPGVEERLDAKEFEQTVHASLQSLAPAYRTILVLVDIEGLSYEAAAGVVGVPIGTVRSRLARARMAMRRRLQETADLLPARQRYQIPQSSHAGMRCQ